MHVAPDTFQQGPSQADWPIFGMVDDIRPALSGLLTQGEAGALATLVGVDGPSPRPIGAQMLITATGEAMGYVSGGCVEGNIAILAQDVIATGIARRFIFGADSPFKDIQLICGTRIDVLIEPVRPDDVTLHHVIKAYLDRTPMTRQTAPDEQGQAFQSHYVPPDRLVIFGADPVALATAHVASAMGLETILVRDKGPSAPPNGFMGRYLPVSVGEAGRILGWDAWTALVTTTHDLEQDHDVLAHGLASDCFYVGALGSKRRLDDRMAKLKQAGLSATQIARLHAPVGLKIGAATPYEIAISILGDVIQARRVAPA